MRVRSTCEWVLSKVLSWKVIIKKWIILKIKNGYLSIY